MKIRETLVRPVGFGSSETFVRVRELPEGEELPPGAEEVHANTKAHDWERKED